MKSSVLLTVCGVVQGVGFRPFAAGIAEEMGLSGYVRNKGGFVEILLSAGQRAVDDYIHRLCIEKPFGDYRVPRLWTTADLETEKRRSSCERRGASKSDCSTERWRDYRCKGDWRISVSVQSVPGGFCSKITDVKRAGEKTVCGDVSEYFND